MTHIANPPALRQGAGRSASKMNPPDKYKFIADINVGKLARWLRIMGYDTLIFKGADDSGMITIALAEDRIILTRDTKFVERRLIKQRKVKAILIESDEPEAQIEEVITALGLPCEYKPFAICLLCNEPLVGKDRSEVKDCVPAYVYETQKAYMECPLCHRVYWKGTHWWKMSDRLIKLRKDCSTDIVDRQSQ